MCQKNLKLKLENYNNCLEITELEKKVNHLEKNNIDVDNLKEDYKEFTKNNKLISKTQQTFKSERHNVFTKEINRFVLTQINNKRMQSIHLGEQLEQSRSSK